MSKPGTADALMANIAKACQASASQETRNKLRRGSTAIKKVATLEAKVASLEKQLKEKTSKELNRVKAQLAKERREYRRAKDRYRAQRNKIKLAAQKVVRGANSINKLKKMKISSVFNDRGPNEPYYASRKYSDALKAVRNIASKGVNDDL